MGIRPAKVIDDGLAEVIAISQGSAGDLLQPRVGRLQPQSARAITAQEARVLRKFLLKSFVNLLRFVGCGFLLSKKCARLFHQLCALRPGPGSRSHVRRLDISKCGETFEGRINPTIERHVRRRIMSWSFCRLQSAFCQSLPTAASQIRIVMRAVYILTGEPTNRGADKHIGRKVLLAQYARSAYSRGQTINQERGKRSRILVRNDSSDGPHCRGMV